jgi:hypothetical protein
MNQFHLYNLERSESTTTRVDPGRFNFVRSFK